MALPPRTPPRFVPTLTEVVQVPGVSSTPGANTTTSAPLQRTPVVPVAMPSHPPAPSSPSPLLQPQGIAARSAPPSALPPAKAPLPMASPGSASLQGGQALSSVTTSVPVAGVARHVSTAAPGLAVHSNAPASTTLGTQRLPDGMEEYMVHRVMQRVDVVLDQRLRDAIATVVQEQTRSVLPRLREEIESVVRHAVYEAVADELASGSASSPRR
ncbi:hypothetical protein [Acidovorax radicis]|uniref:hypothetical protein n=1 Tax=Acidovorax radicis TaxID=758826 RepID=UPI0039B06101